MSDKPAPQPISRYSEEVEDCLHALRRAVGAQTKSPIFGVCAIFMGAREHGAMPILCYQIDEKLDTPENIGKLADFFNRFAEEYDNNE